MTKNNLQRYLVSATYIEEVYKSPYSYQYPRVMGYYDAENEEKAFRMFLTEHAPDIRRAQIFHDDIVVIPVPDIGFKYKMSSVFGRLAKFPNKEILEEMSHE